MQRSVTIDEAKVKQSTKEQIVTQVLADLDNAIASLPNTEYQTAGHAVKGSALALKSRVLLFQKDWAGAASAANQVMTDAKFSLYNNYKNLFLTVGQTGNPEIMFSTRYLNPDNSSQQDIRIEWHAIWNPRQELVNAFECTDGLPITSSPLYNPTNWKFQQGGRFVASTEGTGLGLTVTKRIVRAARRPDLGHQRPRAWAARSGSASPDRRPAAPATRSPRRRRARRPTPHRGRRRGRRAVRRVVGAASARPRGSGRS